MCHTDPNATTVPLSSDVSNLIEADPDSLLNDESKEWYFEVKRGESQGPHTITEMREFFQEGKLTLKSKVWAKGMEQWLRLNDAIGLKWCIFGVGTDRNTISGNSVGKCVLSQTRLAALCLKILHRVITFLPDVDYEGMFCVVVIVSLLVFHLLIPLLTVGLLTGTPFLPVPTAKRIISNPNVLCHIVQILASLNPSLVGPTCDLLEVIVRHNPAVTGKFYLTGMGV